MKEDTALIIAGFIKSMLQDECGWNKEVIGENVYQLLQAIENPEELRK